MRPTRIAFPVPGWGVSELWLLDGRLLELSHPIPEGAATEAGDPLAERVAGWFDGARDDFLDVELELEWCTPLQRALLEALRSVPYGETVSYGELATLAGAPRAARAAGSLCARNPFAIVVPCHRVVASDGIGGYGSLGVEYKRRLLAVEHTSL